MTRTSGVISVLAAALLFSAVPVRADEYTGTSMGQDMKSVQEGHKDQCLIVAMNCPNDRVDTVRQRVDRLNREIAKGSEIYSNEELKALKEQLKWINEDSTISTSE
ncbi:hypothetical protein [Geobacter sp. AOG2]|uniref:hypothetical protein n=1 Tax=Geobacter sp. AOG2 TaxID=1566347 RepID=UPI001CC6E930|nr:hypothetical protein [Geobacter sp. AOG2]GFE61697.1 hypothetical protein AOG2_22840 [Geobacter sp. AOG2]